MTQSKKVFIYHLVDDLGASRYVGKTTNPSLRYLNHIKTNKACPVSRWIGRCIREGRPFRLVVVRECRETDWSQAEKDEIARLRADGAKLLNVLSGGQPGASANEKDRRELKAIRNEIRRRYFRGRDKDLDDDYLTISFIRHHKDELLQGLSTHALQRVKAKSKAR